MSIGRGLTWAYVERWGNRIVSLLVFIALARLLEPASFGIVATAKLLIDYLDSLSAQGLGFAIVQRKTASDSYLNTAFWIIVVMSIAAVALIYALAPLADRLLAESELPQVIRALGCVIVVSALSRVHVAILMRELRFRALAVRGLVSSSCGGAVGILMALNGYGVWSLVYQQIASSLVALLVLWASVAWRPKFEFSLRAAKDLYRFSSKVIIDQQVLFLSKRVDEAIIATFLGVTLLGLYSVAKRLFETLVDILYSALPKVLLPAFAKLQEDPNAMGWRASGVARIMAAIAFPVFIGLAVMGSEVISVFFGEQWLGAAGPFSILMVSGLLILTPNIIHPIFHALGRAEVPMRLNIVRAIVAALVLPVGAMMGLVGVASGVFFRNAVGAWRDEVHLSRIANEATRSVLRSQVFQALYCVPMAAIVAGVAQGLKGRVESPLTLLMICSFFGGLTYLATLIVLRAPVLDDGSRYLNNFRTKGPGDPFGRRGL